MNVERERKFLVEHPPAGLDAGVELRQGYVALDGHVAVRVRQAGDEFTLTVKAGAGPSRTEVEVPLDAGQFAALWAETEGRRVAKTRHRLDHDGVVVELDVFHGALDGLVLAEAEFASDASMDAFTPPPWCAREVTDDPAYTNAALSVAQRPPATLNDPRRSVLGDAAVGGPHTA